MSKLGDEPAYPSTDERGIIWPGMTKQEEFAKAAMQGLVSGDPETVAGYEDLTVKTAMRLADLLLAKLEKPQGETNADNRSGT